MKKHCNVVIISMNCLFILEYKRVIQNEKLDHIVKAFKICIINNCNNFLFSGFYNSIVLYQMIDNAKYAKMPKLQLKE